MDISVSSPVGVGNDVVLTRDRAEVDVWLQAPNPGNDLVASPQDNASIIAVFDAQLDETFDYPTATATGTVGGVVL